MAVNEFFNSEECSLESVYQNVKHSTVAYRNGIHNNAVACHISNLIMQGLCNKDG